MLENLSLENVGPAPRLAIELRERLNLLTGDNGLGKTFLLDTAWWVLTRTWARNDVLPHGKPAYIRYRYIQKNGQSPDREIQFDWNQGYWPVDRRRPSIPGLVLYAQVDGAFSVWDPARNYWRKEFPERPDSYLFSAEEVWDGHEHCEGLIRDWGSWQREGGKAFEQLQSVLRTLSPAESEVLTPGVLRKISLDDPRRHPTLRMPYGQDVALIHASAGMRRILALAYLLVWTWQEHLESCKLLRRAPAREIIFLVDELEAHLHPQWQRRIVESLLEVMEVLTEDHNARVQLIAATHSPLVMASVEPVFDIKRDGLFLLDLEHRQVTLEELPWCKQGDVVNWLVSDTFGLRQGRSLEAERAIEAAEAWMRGAKSDLPEDLRSEKKIDAELRRVLADHDDFWPRWVVWARKRA